VASAGPHASSVVDAGCWERKFHENDETETPGSEVCSTAGTLAP